MILPRSAEKVVPEGEVSWIPLPCTDAESPSLARPILGSLISAGARGTHLIPREAGLLPHAELGDTVSDSQGQGQGQQHGF